ncbi:MAG: nicotinate-nucleotide--dimethylbenzimidazole phosphoribosyltransferase, partial [Thermodesulfobacteriaceae bacterium]|nr:nicotinate-nucleotide--dimethylbenzimidazole phosphoribosyltransferase [Thermodesulfobacteriaceae bacterium]
LARHAGAEVIVVDVGVDYEFEKVEGLFHKKVVRGTKNFLKERALSKEEAEKVIEVGKETVREAIKRGFNLIGLGDMGIGNTTASSAITAVITGRPVEEVTGRGTGITEEMYNKKIEVIKKAIELHKPNPQDALEVLSKVGGAEIGAIAGACLACAENKVPAVIDGFISSAGALLAYKLNPEIKDYLIASHRSEEIGHQAILDYMGLKPLLDLNLRLGEGTGAALAMLIIEGAIKIYREMATFESAKVSTSIV